MAKNNFNKKEGQEDKKLTVKKTMGDRAKSLLSAAIVGAVGNAVLCGTVATSNEIRKEYNRRTATTMVRKYKFVPFLKEEVYVATGKPVNK